MQLEGRKAIVTGGTSGIGRCVAATFAERGARVTVLGRSEAEGAEVSAALAARGGFQRCDLERHVEIARAVERAARDMGGLDTVVTCAGAATLDDVAAMPVAEIDRMIAVNVRGLILLTKHTVPHLEAAGGGAIVNVTSVHAAEATPTDAVYAATKAAADAFTRGAALDLAPRVRVNAVRPGWIDAPLARRMLAALVPDGIEPDTLRAAVAAAQPLRRLGAPEDVAEAVAFLASDAAAFVTGATLDVDGGLTAMLEDWTPARVARLAGTIH